MRSGFRPASLAALLLVALTLIACGGGDKKDERRTGAVTGVPTAPAAAPSTADTATTTPDAAATTTTIAGMPVPKEGVVLERLMVPLVGIDAVIETRGINARGEMEDPGGKDAVAWYDFSEFPGFGGNAVFSGHVDWFTGELGAFGRVRDLKEGDEILLRMSDGMELKYRVVNATVYESAKAPVDQIVGRTEKDSVTFITCEGSFSRSAQDYSHRRVVRAERVS